MRTTTIHFFQASRYPNLSYYTFSEVPLKPYGRVTRLPLITFRGFQYDAERHRTSVLLPCICCLYIDEFLSISDIDIFLSNFYCYICISCAVQAPIACMGPGTGLGQANLYWSENFGGYRVWPSEGAHASFAPRGWKQRALQTFAERQLGYCEVEHVSSYT